MAVDALTVCKQALAALGTDSTIEALTEVSPEARACNLYYETARDLVFSAAPWTSLTGYSRLATKAIRDDAEDWVQADPPPGWLYSFSWPSDCLRPRHLASYARFLPSLARDDNLILATNEETPILVYTRRLTRVDLWGVDLMTAVSHTLAAMIAKSLTGKDADLQNMYQLANERVLQARVNYANTVHTQLESMPDWITARGGSISPPEQRYVYPAANFTISGANNLG